MKRATGIKLAAALVIALLLYAGAGFLLAPPLIERRLTALVEERLGQQLSMDALRINPFMLSVEVSNIRVGAQAGPPLVMARRLYFNYRLLTRDIGRAWVLGEVRAEGLQLQLVLQKNGRLNLADLAAHWTRTAPPGKDGERRQQEEGTTPHFQIKHLLLEEGAVTFRDLSGAVEAVTQAVPIRGELFDLANLPDREGQYTVSARLAEGGVLTWKGDVALLPARGDGQLTLQGLKLATAWKFIRDELRIAEPPGTIDIATRYNFTYAGGKPDVTLHGLRIKASGLSVTPAGGGQPLLALETLEANDAGFQLSKRELNVPSLLLRNGRLRAVQAADGTLDWSRLAATAAPARLAADSGANSAEKPAEKPAAKAAPGPAAPPPARAGKADSSAAWHVNLQAVKLENVAAQYVDLGRPSPMALEASGLQGKAALDMSLGGDALRVVAHGLDLNLAQLVAAPADSKGEARAAPLRLEALSMQGGRFDLGGNLFGAKHLAAEGGAVQLHRAADGSIALLELLKGREPLPEQALLGYAIEAIRLQNLQVSLSDRSFGEPIAYELSGVSAQLSNLSRAGGKLARAKAAGRQAVESRQARSRSKPSARQAAQTDRQAAEVTQVTAAAAATAKPIAFEIAALIADSGTLAASGTAAQDFSAAQARLKLQGFALPTLQPLISRYAAVVLASGRASTDLMLAYDGAAGKPSLRGNGGLSIDTLRLNDEKSGEALIAWQRLSVEQARITLGPDRVAIKEIVIEQPATTIAISAERQLNLAQLLREVKPAKEETAARSAATPAPEATRLPVSIGSVRIRDGTVDFSDRSSGEPIAYQLSGLSAQFSNLSNSGGKPARAEAAAGEAAKAGQADSDEKPTDQKPAGQKSPDQQAAGPARRGRQPAGAAVAAVKPVAFEVAARIGDGGTLAASGTAAQDFSSVEARLKLAGLALQPLQPLLARHAWVKLVSGRGSANALVTYQAAQGKPSLRASGSIALDELRLVEERTNDPVLVAKRAFAEEARFNLNPDRLGIREIVVQGLETKIAISKDRKVNLGQLRKEPADPAKEDGKGRADAAAAPQFPINIGAVRVRDGAVDFSDASLVLPFATRVTAFRGTAAGLSNDPGRHAALQFEGAIGEFGSAQVRGNIDAFSPKTFTDVNVAFENVQMPLFSPYSATFLGRKIASGQLWLELNYKIANSELAGDNKVTIHHLVLGEPVNAPGALRLPVDLAVALLTDSQGRMTVAVPVRGNLDNPHFELGPVIREAIGNLFGRILSAPFRALAGLFGGGDEALDSVEFDAGSARLLPSQREKLQSVTKALQDRPQLRLVAQAGYDPERDTHALREDLVRRELARSLGRAPEPDEPPDPIPMDSFAAQRAMERMLAARGGDEAIKNLERAFAERTGKEPGRVGVLLRRAGDAAFYDMLFARLIETQPLPQSAGQQLGARRAAAVIAYLKSVGVESARLQAGKPEAAQESKGARVSAKLSLEAAPAQNAAAAPSASPESPAAAPGGTSPQ